MKSIGALSKLIDIHLLRTSSYFELFFAFTTHLADDYKTYLRLKMRYIQDVHGMRFYHFKTLNSISFLKLTELNISK